MQQNRVSGLPGVTEGTESRVFLLDIYPELNKTFSLVAQMVKNLPAMQETQVPSLDWKDRLEKGMATHSSVLAWRIP